MSSVPLAQAKRSDATIHSLCKVMRQKLLFALKASKHNQRNRVKAVSSYFKGAVCVTNGVYAYTNVIAVRIASSSVPIHMRILR